MIVAVFADDGTVKASRRSRPLAGAITLEVVEGPSKSERRTLPVGERLSIGSSEDNDLCLGDRTVSRYHAELEATAGGLRVRDLDSLNGTFIDGVRIESAVALPGTRLRLGDSVLAVADATERPPQEAGPDAEVPGLLAVSPAMRVVARDVARIAPTTVSVLVLGETGTGKEVVARAIHELSPRRGGPFVVVDCGSLAPTLVASELFGHERGSFTGAERRHAGAFERADGGTLFLDEVGELPLEVQPALLGALERRRFRRVGGSDELAVDVRVVSATHRDLRASTNTGRFRPDLYFRLAVARLVLPPLRERPEEIEPLVRHFVQKITGQAGMPFDAATLHALSRHHFAGNVRELRNAVETALAMGHVDLSPPAAASPPAPAAVAAYRDARADAIAAFERSYLGSLIERCGGNASEAARQARMDRPYLLALLKKHGLR